MITDLLAQTVTPPPKRPYAVYVNLDKRRYKVRIHVQPCKEIRKNNKPENEKHYWCDFETLEEAIVFADQTAYEHGLSPWTENKCGCGVNQRGILS